MDAAAAGGASPDGALSPDATVTSDTGGALAFDANVTVDGSPAPDVGPALDVGVAADAALPGHDAADEVPDAADEAPDAADEVPDAADEAPDAADEVPDAADEVPDAADEVPDAADEVPDAADGVPDAADAVPDAADVVVDAADEVPDAVAEPPLPATPADRCRAHAQASFFDEAVEGEDGHWRLALPAPDFDALPGACERPDAPEHLLRFEPPRPGTWIIEAVPAPGARNTLPGLYVARTCDEMPESMYCSSYRFGEPARTQLVLEAGGGAVLVVASHWSYGDALTLRATHRPALGLGEVCGNAADLALCDRNLACFYPVGGVGEPVCGVETDVGFFIDSAQATLDERRGWLTFAFSGRAPDGAGGSVEPVLIGANGTLEPIPYTADIALGVPNPRQLVGGPAFSGMLTVSSRAVDVGGRFGLRIHRGLGGVTPVFEVPVTPLPVLNDGASCDPRQRTGRCAPGLTCHPMGQVHVCMDVEVVCAGDVDGALGGDAPADPDGYWRTRGQTAALPLVRPSCSRPPCSKHRFTAPADGRYVFQVRRPDVAVSQGPGGLYSSFALASGCRTPGVEQVAPFGSPGWSTTVLEMVAGESVFIDASHFFPGEYTVAVGSYAPSALVGGDAIRRPDGRYQLEVTLRDPGAVAFRAQVDFLDADCQPLPGWLPGELGGYLPARDEANQTTVALGVIDPTSAGEPARVRITALDGDRIRGVPAELPVTAPHVLAVGEGCGRFDRRCGQGLTCDTRAVPEPVCREAALPVVHNARLAVDPEFAYFRLDVESGPQAAYPSTVRIWVLDEDGAQVFPLRPWSPIYELPLNGHRLDGETWRVKAKSNVRGQFDAVRGTRARVQVGSALGPWSDAFELAVEPLMSLEEGAPCTDEPGEPACAPGLVCAGRPDACQPHPTL